MGFDPNLPAIRQAYERGLIVDTGPATPPAPAVPETERDFTARVIGLARSHGWLVLHIRPALTRAGNWVTPVAGDGTGYPDLTIARDRLLVRELKTAKGRLTPAQRLWLERLTAAGVDAGVWRPSQWLEIVDTLT